MSIQSELKSFGVKFYSCCGNEKEEKKLINKVAKNISRMLKRRFIKGVKFERVKAEKLKKVIVDIKGEAKEGCNPHTKWHEGYNCAMRKIKEIIDKGGS